MARPVSWPSKITGASPEAMEFYELVAKLQRTTAFADCHVYHGARIGDLPHVAFGTTTTNLPRMICGFLGIPYRKRLCNTPGCMNPFHYTNVAMQQAFVSPEFAETPVVPLVDKEAYRELIQYVIDEHEIPTPPTFENIRKYVPVEDMDDLTLKETIQSWT